MISTKVLDFKTLSGSCLFFVGTISFFLIVSSCLCESTAYGALPETFVSIAKDIKPSVVNIRTTKVLNGAQHMKSRKKSGNTFHGKTPSKTHGKDSKIRTQGSGILIDKKGYIITNDHVVRDANEIIVRLHDNNEFKAELVGTDAKSNITVLKIAAEDLKPAKLRNSDSLEIGETVLAIGSDFGLGQTVSNGIIRAKGGPNVQLGGHDEFFLTNADINKINNGGPLIDVHGKVVGVNTVIVTQKNWSYGTSFVIPINVAKKVMEDLIAHGKVERGWLGVTAQIITPQLQEALGLKNNMGVLISDIEPNSPAVAGGLKSGDVVIEYDGEKVKDLFHLRSLVTNTKIDKKVEVVVLRDGKELKLMADIIERLNGKIIDKKGLFKELGLMVQTLTRDLALNIGYENVEGVIITNVQIGSSANKAGLRVGDLIVEVQHKPVINIDDFFRAIMDYQKEENILLYVRRQNGTSSFIVLKINKEEK